MTTTKYQAEQMVDSRTGDTDASGLWCVVNTESGQVRNEGLSESDAQELADELNAE